MVNNYQLYNAWIWFGWSVSRAAICNRFQKLSFFGIVWRCCVLMIKLTFEQKLNSKKNTQFLRPFLHYKIYDSHRFGKYMTTRRTETNIPPGTGCVQQQEMLYHWKTTLPRYWEQSLLFHRNFLLCGKRYCAVAGPEVLHSLVATFQISSSSSSLSSSLPYSSALPSSSSAGGGPHLFHFLKCKKKYNLSVLVNFGKCIPHICHESHENSRVKFFWLV